MDSFLESDSGRLVCSSWMRTGECIYASGKKCRCRRAHDVEPMSCIRNVSIVPEIFEEVAVFHVPFREVLPRHRLHVRFVAVDGFIVFDYQSPGVWLDYIGRKMQTHVERSAPFLSLAESASSDDEEDKRDGGDDLAMLSPETVVEAATPEAPGIQYGQYQV